jgi:3-deoxy-D-manno-octulosonic-acid transferase
MTYLLNLLYLVVLLLCAPFLLYKGIRTGNYRRGFAAKLLGRVAHPLLTSKQERTGPCLWFHGVSVGEIHLLRQVVAAWRKRRPDCHVVVSTTTDTGYDEAVKCFPDLAVIYWPFDFTWAIKTALGRVQPDVAVLAESEIWPSFVTLARRCGVKLAIINGRMSPRSVRRFQKLDWLARSVFSKIDLIAAQTEEYAANYRTLGGKCVLVTGSVKYDGAQTDRGNAKTQSLRRLFAILPDELVWVAGSTQHPEDTVALDAYRRLRDKWPTLRLIIVPRQKDRFDEVARLLEQSGLPFVRRSALGDDNLGAESARFFEPGLNERPIILVDTIGELGAVWGLADIAFVGGSLDGQRGGQNMIEPAAYGAAVLFGPHTWNFKDTVARLNDHDAALVVRDAAELEREVAHLLADTAARRELGERARLFVLSQQGATAKTLEALDTLCDRTPAFDAESPPGARCA